METTEITFVLKLPSGAAVSGGKITFTLSGYDFDGGIVMPEPIEAPISGTGTGSIKVWPNIAGLKNTSYKVQIIPSSGTKLELSNVTIPASTVPVALHTLVPVTQVGGLTTVVLSQAEYDALSEKSAQTIYLIRAGE